MSAKTKSWTNPRPRSSTNWQNLRVSEGDDGKRWRILWDTTRGADKEPRNTAVEKTKPAALDRARHMRRMGFFVYEIRDPSGAIVTEEPTMITEFGNAVAT